MSRVTVPVTRAFTHKGQARHPGEAIEVEAAEAAALARREVVSLTRQTYQTRDMVAAGRSAGRRPERKRKDLSASGRS